MVQGGKGEDRTSGWTVRLTRTKVEPLPHIIQLGSRQASRAHTPRTTPSLPPLPIRRQVWPEKKTRLCQRAEGNTRRDGVDVVRTNPILTAAK